MLGLRSARITLCAPGKPEFTLYPMIHVAERQFFERVRDDAAAHDLVLYEGVRGPFARLSDFIFRYFASGSVDLAFQLDHLRGEDLPNGRYADMDERSFLRNWRRLPLVRRFLSWLTAPAAWAVMRLQGPRRLLTTDVDSLDDSDRQESYSDTDGRPDWMSDVVLIQRDAILAAHCDRAIAEGRARSIGVIYGAGHMPALVQHLYRRGYRPAGGAWMTAIEA